MVGGLVWPCNPFMVLVAVPHLVSIWMDFTFADGLLFSFGLWAHFLINDTEGIFDPKKRFYFKCDKHTIMFNVALCFFILKHLMVIQSQLSLWLQWYWIEVEAIVYSAPTYLLTRYFLHLIKLLLISLTIFIPLKLFISFTFHICF